MWQSIAHTEGTPTASRSHEDTPTNNHTELICVTANITSWSNGWPLIQPEADDAAAQVLLLQETRVTKATARGAMSKANFEGWDLHVAAATATGRRGPAPGGVAIAVRRGRASAMLQLGPAISVGAEGRLVAAVIEGGTRGGPLVVASILIPTPPPSS